MADLRFSVTWEESTEAFGNLLPSPLDNHRFGRKIVKSGNPCKRTRNGGRISDAKESLVARLGVGKPLSPVESSSQESGDDSNECTGRSPVENKVSEEQDDLLGLDTKGVGSTSAKSVSSGLESAGSGVLGPVVSGVSGESHGSSSRGSGSGSGNEASDCNSNGASGTACITQGSKVLSRVSSREDTSGGSSQGRDSRARGISRARASGSSTGYSRRASDDTGPPSSKRHKAESSWLEENSFGRTVPRFEIIPPHQRFVANINVLGQYGITLQNLNKDMCVVQNLMRLEMGQLLSEEILRCLRCTRKIDMVEVLRQHNRFQCECGEVLWYSFCENMLCSKDIGMRKHCLRCQRCQDDRCVHCDICDECYIPACKRRKCPCEKTRKLLEDDNCIIT